MGDITGMFTNLKLFLCGGICVALFVGCAAQPPTHYYDLAPQASVADKLIGRDITLGVGPVTLPQLLDRPGVVTRQHESGVKVANYHIWAGELEPTFTRVLAESIALRLQQDTIWPSPWDNRFRPEYQLRIFVNQYSGELKGEVVLSLTWTLLADYGNKVISTRRYRATANSEGGYLGYVSTLNQLLAGFAGEVSIKLSEFLSEE